MTRFKSVNVGAAVVSAALLAGAATLAAVPAGAAVAGCSVNYTVASQWQGGFTANVSFTNLGDPLTSWTLGWSFGAGQTVTQAWNATVTQNGSVVDAKNVSYNGSVATGGVVSLGFNGSWTGSNPVPSSFSLNGVQCTGTTTTTTTTTTSTTTTTTTTTPGGCTLPSRYRWTSTGVLANPRSGWVSLKDFTTVMHNGRHLVYGTTHDFGDSWGSMNFGLFTNW
ncbi:MULTISPECIES: non-reducing end alpha-L-arabinofuranosidase family hydrolase, partial [unclassified Saccharothrix]|uniref:non-reducing end alpha-L-arabinofuranosidase family hydrolase n=1 Tax=unclassified Saccharothrix TaxID=2593673 RepID=UPI00307FABED